MADEGSAARKSKLEELILKKKQEQEEEKEALRQKRPREDNIDDIDFGDDSEDEGLDVAGTYLLLWNNKLFYRLVENMGLCYFTFSLFQIKGEIRSK